MSKNLQFIDDPDDVPYINESITLHVGIDGSDEENSGAEDAPFRTLGKAVDVVRNKIIGKENFVTIQLGAVRTDRTGYVPKKYFEEEKVKIDFESAKRIKIKGVKPTDHEVVGISYFDKAQDRDGYYCQVLVTNQDKINIGDYIGIYDHVNAKKKDPSYFWVRSNTFTSYLRMINPNNCYAEVIRGDMILGVHEVVDVGPSVKTALPTELFAPQGLEIGVVTLHVKNNNHTYKRLNEIPFYSGIGTKNGEQILRYGTLPGYSPEDSKLSIPIPPIFYGAEMLSRPDDLLSKEYEQFYYAGGIQMIEIVDIMVRGYGLSLSPLDGKIYDDRPGRRSFAKDATLLWNDPTLTRHYRVLVANKIATYFYKKMINDLRLDADLPFYFGKSTDPTITVKELLVAAKKIRDFLLSGAKNIEGVPVWDEKNHPGYGYGPFDTGVYGSPLNNPDQIDKTSYPREYADENKLSLLLQSYNLYPPINGQMYGPTLVKRITRWYNEIDSLNGLQLERWTAKGYDSPFFCGYITPQGWFKRRWITDNQGYGGNSGNDITTLERIESEGKLASDGLTHGYWEVFGGTKPIYVGNPSTNFNSVANGTVGAYSNDKNVPKNLSIIDESSFNYAYAGVTNGGWSGNTGPLYRIGTMGSAWYTGTVNSIGSIAGGVVPGLLGGVIFDQYSLGYSRGAVGATNDSINDKTTPVINGDNETELDLLHSTQTTILRAKCYKTVVRFGKDGICVDGKTKLGFLKDLCLVGLSTQNQTPTYGLLSDQESVVTASNIAVAGFNYGISAKNQSLINLLADLGDSAIVTSVIDPGAICSANGIGIISTNKSHINARRTVVSGSRLANYFTGVNSSLDCSNSVSVCSHGHGYVCDFNSYMKAHNAFSEFNGGVGFCASNNSILVCHRGRSIWNGGEGVLAQNKSQIKALEFISRSNDADGFLAKNKSVITAGQNSTDYSQYRKEFLKASGGVGAGTILEDTYYGTETSLPPFMFRVLVEDPEGGEKVVWRETAVGINNSPIQGLNVLYHECNSTISEFNAGSGFAADGDSTIIADNTIARYNSKRYGEFFLYGWSGTRGAFATDTFVPREG